ncbi:MAG TPA: RsmG family class I SAM-dependent methyltransferase, partial [Pirellulaceae bacterium]|nr:RsmG family class I SAM-dependent methyltransferase [Pirellulaceae bacterium]
MDDAATDTLAAALVRHEIELPKDQMKQVDHYIKLLWDWNEKINLTRHTDYDKFVARDLSDTVELSKLLHPEEEVLEV